MTIWWPPSGPHGLPGTALFTDHYELTALEAARRSGVAQKKATFELFSRGLPDGRRYGVVAGMARAIDAVERFRFHPDDIAWLRERGFLSEETLDWLADYRFGGDIVGYRDGELFFPYSPILTVDATFGEAVLLETVLLSILNHDCAVAAAAARMDVAAGDRLTIEGGGRRTHQEAAVDAALAAHIAGVDVTSNLEAGRRFGLPTAGTTMHAFTLAHDSEEEAFAAQVAAFGPESTFLVDTYDTPEGIRRAVEAAGTGIGAIRIDSGEIGEEARRARAQLDALGAVGCEIVVSGDLDEYRLAELADAPIDRYLLGTRLVTGSGAPTAELVYKLVEIDGRPVAKTSPGKGHRGGRKVATRVIDASGRAIEERLVVPGDEVPPPPPGGFERGLQTEWIRAGRAVRPFAADAARAHHLTARAELPPTALDLAPGPPHLDGHPPSDHATTPDTEVPIP